MRPVAGCWRRGPVIMQKMPVHEDLRASCYVLNAAEQRWEAPTAGGGRVAAPSPAKEPPVNMGRAVLLAFCKRSATHPHHITLVDCLERRRPWQVEL